MKGTLEVANLLLQWGPAGAAAVLIFIAEKKLRVRWDLSKGKDRKVCSCLYIGNWLFVAILLMAVSIVWIVDRNKTTITMSGVVQDLRTSYKVNDPTKELFTKTTLKSNWLQDIHWHYSKPNLPDQVEIRLENKDDFNDYSVPLKQVDDVLNIRAVFKEGKLWLKSKNEFIELQSVHSASKELKPITKLYYPPKFKMMSVAYADEQLDVNLVLDALESDDSYVRQSASQYIVNNINALAQVVDDKIVSDDTSETMQIGLVSALARASSPELSTERNWKVSEKAEKQIFAFYFSKNPVLAAQSKRYIIRNISENHLKWLDSKCNFSSKEKTKEMSYCSFIAMNLIYNLSINKWMNSLGKQKDEAIYEVNRAIDILDKGLNLWQSASEEEEIQFGKIYYGKAFLYNELSKLQAGDASKIAKQKSVEYFKKLLAYLQKKHLGAYEYPHHVEQANCYIESQVQDCFDKFAP
ncbi:MAG: hypothetical protein WC836_21570 [Desulfobacula sp.]|jgi:hypothetical protein